MNCDRCGSFDIDNHWTNGTGWNAGEIILFRASQVCNPLYGGTKACAEVQHIKASNVPHKLIKDQTGQRVILRWGQTTESYRLCPKCQTELIRRVGEFFRLPEIATRIKKQIDAETQHL